MNSQQITSDDHARLPSVVRQVSPIRYLPVYFPLANTRRNPTATHKCRLKRKQSQDSCSDWFPHGFAHFILHQSSLNEMCAAGCRKFMQPKISAFLRANARPTQKCQITSCKNYQTHLPIRHPEAWCRTNNSEIHTGKGGSGASDWNCKIT